MSKLKGSIFNRSTAAAFIIAFVVVVLGFTADAVAQGKSEVRPHEKQGPPAFEGDACAVIIDFGSHASGVDQELYSILALELLANDEVVKLIATPWGKEGEVSLCAVPRRVKGLVPIRYLTNAVISDHGKPKKGYVKLR